MWKGSILSSDSIIPCPEHVVLPQTTLRSTCSSDLVMSIPFRAHNTFPSVPRARPKIMRLLLLFLLSALASVGASAGPEASTAATSDATSAVHAREDNVKHPKGLRGVVGILDDKQPTRVDVDEERFTPMIPAIEFVVAALEEALQFLNRVREFCGVGRRPIPRGNR